MSDGHEALWPKKEKHHPKGDFLRELGKKVKVGGTLSIIHGKFFNYKP